MKDSEIGELIMTIQSMEERSIFVKDHDIMDAIELVKFNRIIDNDLMMNKLINNEIKTKEETSKS